MNNDAAITRSRKDPSKRLRNGVQFLLTDEDYALLLERAEGKDLSAFCREIILASILPSQVEELGVPHSPFDGEGDVMELDEYLNSHRVGTLNGDDGFGEYGWRSSSNEIMVSNMTAHPTGAQPPWATLVIWYNK